MNIEHLYGGEAMPVTNYLKPRESFSFTPKKPYEPLPMGAIIIDVEKSVNVREISNGYLKCVYTTTKYKIKEEDGDFETEYHYDEKETYSAEKPLDALKIYM